MFLPEAISEIKQLHALRGKCVLEVLSDSNECGRQFRIGGDTYVLDLDGAIPTVKLSPSVEHEQWQPTGLRRAYDKVAAQMRQANIGVDYPRLEEPAEETGFVYPKDKVIDIRKGRKLNRRG